MSRHLYRSRDDRMLAGVAGGLAELWDVDPSLIRIVWALLVIFTGGIALVLYILMAIVVPEEGDTTAYAQPAPGSPAGTSAFSATSSPGGAGPAAATSTAPPEEDWRQARSRDRIARREARLARHAARGRGGRSGSVVIGVLLILLGTWFLVRQYIPAIDWDWFWPLILIALGVLVLALAIRPRSDGPE
jgi:phage shock protein PspC (stress-responsive transcriptional regulator)